MESTWVRVSARGLVSRNAHITGVVSSTQLSSTQRKDAKQSAMLSLYPCVQYQCMPPPSPRVTWAYPKSGISGGQALCDATILWRGEGEG